MRTTEKEAVGNMLLLNQGILEDEPSLSRALRVFTVCLVVVVSCVVGD